MEEGTTVHLAPEALVRGLDELHKRGLFYVLFVGETGGLADFYSNVARHEAAEFLRRAAEQLEPRRVGH